MRALLPFALALAACSAPTAVEPEPLREPGAPLVFSAQEGWVEEPPASDMRVVQYVLGDASLVVFHFGAAGGTVEANFERWASQFEPTGGGEVMIGEFAERTVLGMPVHEVAYSGTYVAETSPGSGERVNHPEWRLVAAVVESGHGPYYVKLVGPEQAVRRWEPSFGAFLDAIR